MESLVLFCNLTRLKHFLKYFWEGKGKLVDDMNHALLEKKTVSDGGFSECSERGARFLTHKLIEFSTYQ